MSAAGDRRDDIVAIGDGEVVVEVLPRLGARLHRLVAFGHDLLWTPDELDAYGDEPFAWGGYLMAPWCNRADPATVQLGARRATFTPNFVDGTAIHGLVHDRPFERDGEASWRIEVGPGGWPWRHQVRVDYEVVDRTLQVRLTVRNDDTDPMPAGIGFHPWFRAPVEVEIPARSMYPSNLTSEPEPRPVDARHDQRSGGPLHDGVDATWTDLSDRRLRLCWPEPGVSAEVTWSPEARYVVAAAPGGMGATAVEVQTHGPNGIRRTLSGEPGALDWLAPEDELTVILRYAFGRDDLG
jgi:aldose 1-epimerase